MLGKLLFLAAGYMLGARAGRKRYDQIARVARTVAERDEVQTAVGLARSTVQAAIENVLGTAGGRRGSGRRAA